MSFSAFWFNIPFLIFHCIRLPLISNTFFCIFLFFFSKVKPLIFFYRNYNRLREHCWVEQFFCYKTLFSHIFTVLHYRQRWTSSCWPHLYKSEQGAIHFSWQWMVHSVKLELTFAGLLVKLALWRYPWCNGYRRRKWTRRHEIKSWTRLIAFHIALILLGMVWIQLFSLQLWANSWAD